MKVRTGAWLLAGLLLGLPLWAQESGSQPPLTQNEFVTLVNAKMPVDEIIAQIRARGIAFEVTPELEEPLKKVEGGTRLLQALREPATLELRVNVPAASVAVDGVNRGFASAEGKVVVGELSPGTHLIRVEAPGYVSNRSDVFLKPAESRQVAIELTAAVVSTPGPLGRQVKVQAGTDEDSALVGLELVSEPAARAEKLKAIIERFPESPLALLVYGMLQEAYLDAEQFDNSIAAGQEALRRDPNNFAARLRLARAYRGKGDLGSAFEPARQAREQVEKLEQTPVPEGASPGEWERAVGQALPTARNELASLAYDLFVSAAAVEDAARKAALLEQFVGAFPQSDYSPQAAVQLALAYQQQGNIQKLLEWADRALEANPNQPLMLVLVADALSDAGQQLARARESANRLLGLLSNQSEKVRPAGWSDEQWAEQRQLWEGLAHSALGYVSLHEGKAAASLQELRAAGPLLKGQTQLYARNLYRLGYALASLGGRENMEEAQRVLSELVQLGTPYAPPARELLTKVEGALRGRRQ